MTWDDRWSRTADADFEWSLGDEVAPQLRRLFEGDATPGGPSLDLGCGAGVSTRYLAERAAPALGVDIAYHALGQARAGGAQPGAHFAAGDALALPVRSGAVGVVFDRGCLQNLPRSAWAGYFREAHRVMAPGATMVLLVSKMVARFPPPTTVDGLRLRWSWYVKKRRTGPQFLTHEFLRSVAEPVLSVQSMSDFDFVTRKKKARRFTHAVLTRAQNDQHPRDQ